MSSPLFKKSLLHRIYRNSRIELYIKSCKRLFVATAANHPLLVTSTKSQQTKATTTWCAVVLSSFLVLGGGIIYKAPIKTKLDVTTVSGGAAAISAHSDSTTSSAISNDNDNASTTTTLLNWSGTHTVTVHNQHYYEPETIEEVESIVRRCHEMSQPLRPLGSALSPNGIAFSSQGMISMANLDQIIKVDPERMTVTVQAGARVSQVSASVMCYGHFTRLSRLL